MMHFFEIKVLKVRHVDYIVFINQCAACSMLVGKPYIVSKSFSFVIEPSKSSSLKMVFW